MQIEKRTMIDAFLITEIKFELTDFILYAGGLFKFEWNNEFEIVHEIINRDKTYFSISKDDSIFDLMEPDEQNQVLSKFEAFNIFSCSFYQFEYFQTLVASIPTSRNILVDNDYGSMMELEEFLKFNTYDEFVGRI